LDCELRLAPIDGERAPDEACKDAELYAAAAAIDRLNLDHRGAADKYDAAARLVSNAAETAGAPRVSAGAEWRFRMAQARALVDDDAQRGHGDSLIGAIKSYDRALDAVSRAETPFAWAETQFHRADALLASGVNDNEPSRVEEAVGSYQLALEEWTHDAAPFEWARTQNNLGDALQRLAEMEDGVERLRPAAEAYRAALRAWTRRTAPDLFALAQGNLGDALAVMGARIGDEAMLREAICAYRAALSELRRDLAPQEWARMQNNLGNAPEALSEQAFCERKYDRDQLRQAVEAFQSALEGQTPEASPAEFAATNVNLGDALLALGEGEAAENPAYGHDLLSRAAAAYRAALSTADGQAPVDAAKIKINLAYALGLLWNGTRNRQMLNEALAMLDGAIAAIKGTTERQHVADAERARERILAALAQAA
jgi:tetratricopeptide (TPR) repeat protein